MQTNDERGRECEPVADGATPQDASAVMQSVESSEGREEAAACDALQAAGPSERGHHSTMALPHKKSARGMSGRRRIGLKIESDHSKTRGDAHANDKEKEAQLRPLALAGEHHGGDGSETGGGGGGEEWWKLEYRAPQPGHLGAHMIGRDEEHKQSPSRARNSGALPPTPSRGSSCSSVSSCTSAERPHLEETPEHARKVRGGSDRYDSAISHSSPNPKRKIMDTQDIEAGSFPSMGVAKEPKRFHEPNGEQQQLLVEGESELARTLRTAMVTPSKLLRSIKKIDIQAGSAPSTTAKATTTATGAQPLEKKTAATAGKASESA